MDEKILLLGCGILQKEVRFLIAKNQWPVEMLFLDSALHIDFDKLAKGLNGSLAKHREQHCVVFYGACHPLIDRMLAAEHTFRTPGQNCVDILLGFEVFSRELENGAFFLMEDWARRWDHITRLTYGTDKLSIVREILKECQRTYVLALRTPCSADFSAAAEDISRKLDWPLRWLDVNLDHLEAVLRQTVERKLAEL
jgi:hypothetical protein